VSHLAWKAQPPDESSEDRADVSDEEAEVVDLSKQRLLGWVKGMFGGSKRRTPSEDG